MARQNSLKILAIIDRLDLPTSIVRVTQFLPLADADPDIEMKYIARRPRWLTRFEQIWPKRKWMRWVVDLIESIEMWRVDHRILREAALADMVYTINTPTPVLNRRIQQRGTQVVVDIIDALWLPWFQRFDWDNLEQMLRDADGVICENRFALEYLQQHNPRTVIVPDVPQLEAFDRLRGKVQPADDEITIGWIGGANTADALYGVFPVLERLFAEYPQLHLRILGATSDDLPRFEKVRYSCLPCYDQDQMITEALKMHIGIFPQYDVEESRCRGTLKTKIYMAAGLATVCQNVGENTQLIVHDQNGLLADDDQSWFDRLSYLITHPEERQRLGAAGLQMMRERFTKADGWANLRAALKGFQQQDSVDDINLDRPQPSPQVGRIDTNGANS
jgi:glycosyltransferase involved in cell wall biosynthesis